MDENKLYKVYDVIINNNELSTKDLKNIGFTQYEITKLVDSGVLKRIKRGYYDFIDEKSLYNYGRQLIKNKEYDKGSLCFYKCFELNPKNQSTCYQLLYKNVCNRDYEATLKFFDVMLNTDNIDLINDCNLYLFVINNIIDLPEKYKEYVKHLKFENIRVDYYNTKYNDMTSHNKIRSAIFNNKFQYALKLLRELCVGNKKKITMEYIILKTLLQDVNQKVYDEKNAMSEMLNNKEYYKLVEFLEHKGKISQYEKMLLTLLKDLLYIKNNKRVPEKKINNTTNIEEAINGSNYDLALELSEDYANRHNIKNSTISILLKEILYLSNNIIDKEKTNKNNGNSLMVIMGHIINNDFENAIPLIKEFMERINMSEYTLLIINLFKLSIIENDKTYNKAINVLNDMNNGNYVFDLSYYIKEFYSYLFNNKYEEARIYINIISSVNKDDNLINNLNDTLFKAEEIFKNKTTQINKVDEEKEDSLILPDIKNIFIERNKDVKTSVEKDDPDFVFIKNKRDLLVSKGGLILLKSMSYEKIEKLKKYIKDYDDLQYIVIEDGNNIRLALRCVYKINDINLKELYKTSEENYKNKKYEEALEGYMTLLKINNPYSYIYFKIAMCNLKLRHKKTALDYLKVANHLCKVANSNIDYYELINKLQNNTKLDERKIFVKMDENEFEENNNYFGIENFEEINRYVHNSGISVHDSLKELNMSDEQINIIKLIYAIEYYKQNDMVNGDSFLNDVENTKNKSSYVVKLCKEIRTNKNFYKNRVSDDSNILTLKLRSK